jgi:hypothetical protein
MLQERERERREGARSAGLMSRQPTRTDIRYQGEGEKGGGQVCRAHKQAAHQDRYQVHQGQGENWKEWNCMGLVAGAGVGVENGSGRGNGN